MDEDKPSPLSNWPRYPGGLIAGALLAAVSVLLFLDIPALRQFLHAARILVGVLCMLWVLWLLFAYRSGD